MKREAREFLVKLLNTPSPSGFEQPVQRIVRREMEKFADTVTTDLHGNVIVGINTSAKRRVMLAGHCDQIGFMVRHISNDGYLYVSSVGGIDAGTVQGAEVTVWTKSGPLQGVMGRKPIHHQKSDERGKGHADLEKIWIDIGAKDKKEAEKLIQIGDPATFKLGINDLQNDMIAGPGLDDKVGLFIALETLRRCKSMKLSVALYAVSTVQEEVGLRGARTAAFTLDPEVGIGIDVTHASDNPGNENTKAIPCRLGDGPAISRGPNTNPVVEQLLLSAAKKHKIPYQLLPNSAPLGNDTNAIQISRGGVAAACIGVPNRYMHTQVEVCSLVDLDNAVRLLTHFVSGITSKTDFTPL